MNKICSKLLFYVGSLVACAVMALSTGCASGGFKLTREYARWVNSQNIVLRVILYILTFVVFAVTMLIDAVLFNTMDFWQGKVSQGTYEFKDEGKTFIVKHEISPGTSLKKSTIDVLGEKSEVLQNVVISETAKGEIELYVNGKLKTRVTDISSLPVASFYGENGQVTQQDLGLLTPAVALH